MIISSGYLFNIPRAEDPVLSKSVKNNISSCVFAGEYARTCLGDGCDSETAVIGESNSCGGCGGNCSNCGGGCGGSSSGSCDVYVWGSNSSHQLAEGTHDKILTPKLTHAFTSVQQVCTCVLAMGKCSSCERV